MVAPTAVFDVRSLPPEAVICLALLALIPPAPQDPTPSVAPTAPSHYDDLRADLRGLKEELHALRERASETLFPIERWYLFSRGRSGFVIEGWLAQNFAVNPSRPRDGYNGPVTWPDRANEYQLTELYAVVQDDELLAGDGWSFGARIDLLFGANYRFVTSAGLESQWNNDDESGFAMPNAYAELVWGEVAIKAGHFVSPVGHATVGTANNFFQILPYTFQYGEPFTHTGALATARVSTDLSLGIGLIEGWDSTANWSSDSRGQPPDAWNRHLGLLLTATLNGVIAEADSLAYVGVLSSEPDLGGLGREPRYLQTLVWTLPLAAAWQWVLQSDFGYESRALTTDGRAAQWYGLNQYLFWSATEHWHLGANLEWFRDDDGFRVLGPAPSFGSPRGRSFGRGPFRGNFYRAMVGANWSPHPNLTLRHAIAYDRFDGERASDLLPFDDGAGSDQWLFLVDLLLRF